MSFGESFVYGTLRDELVIGEVYVRVYNVQPTFVLEVCVCVCVCVLLIMVGVVMSLFCVRMPEALPTACWISSVPTRNTCPL